MDLDPANLEPREAYRFLTSAVVPRPIAWVSTRAADGALNLAPFSFFNAFSSAPMILGVSVSRHRGGEPKDTLKNALETEAFVVNVVSETLAEGMVATSATLPHGENEFELAGFTPEPSLKVDAPRVAESPVSFECILYDSVDLRQSRARGGEALTPNASTLLLGEVVHVRVHDDVLDERGCVRADRLRPIARLGGIEYAGIGDLREIPRPPRPSEHRA